MEAIERIIENPLKKERTTFIKTSTETGGEYSLVEVELEPGGGVDPHYHRYLDEEFQGVKGVVDVIVDGQTYRVGPGEKKFAPRGTTHGFKNNTAETVVFRALVTPGSTGFENMLRVAYGLCRDGLTTAGGVPKGFSLISVVSQLGESNAPGFFSFMNPLLRWGARRARDAGISEELIKRYGGEPMQEWAAR